MLLSVDEACARRTLHSHANELSHCCAGQGLRLASRASMNTVYPNHAKRRLASGKLAIGMVLRQARTVDIGATAKTCGFDWFSIDMEHGSFDVDTAAQIVSAALPVGITPIVRVPGQEPHYASRLL